jgi:hypothetical protein
MEVVVIWPAGVSSSDALTTLLCLRAYLDATETYYLHHLFPIPSYIHCSTSFYMPLDYGLYCGI